MSKEIKINQEAVNADVQAISGAAGDFENAALNPSDHQSSITANAKGQGSYGGAQQTKQNFGSAIKQEASNIKSLGVTFLEHDSTLAKQWESSFTKG